MNNQLIARTLLELAMKEAKKQLKVKNVVFGSKSLNNLGGVSDMSGKANLFN